MWLLILFIVVPLIEIALFIQVGGAIGLLATLVIVIATAFLGAALVRSQGAQAMANLRRSMNELTDPTEHLAHGAMILFSGALLLTPGFFTDAIGFALLVPSVRLAVYKALRARVNVQSFEMGGRPQPHGPQDRVIDGEFEEVDPEKRPTHGPSGWTKH
ncbi:FxsA family protein [Octadecabacter sp. R77987]|uniref:FxsA family protein n=1 Tax=Octadecabacter sp. R77987 TaxID=3093874 RepID=UPI0036724564